MTTIITRLFPSRESAAAVARDLDFKRFPKRAVQIIYGFPVQKNGLNPSINVKRGMPANPAPQISRN